MVISGQIAFRCSLPQKELGFSTLADITRVGGVFCKSPSNLTAVESVQKYRAFRMGCLETTLDMVDAMQPPSQTLVSIRLKRLDSIRRKITRKDAKFELGQMDDIIGVRIICPSFQEVLDMSKRIRNSPEFYRPKDYLQHPHPKSTGYRAIHHIMRFPQALSENKFIPVRFEIQVRSLLQHRWAVWSESHGENTKAGKASEKIKLELQGFSEQIEKWEKSNPDISQGQLLPYTNAKNIIVAWRQKNSLPLWIGFREKTNNAILYLNRLETKYPDERGNALLLVGVSNSGEVEKILSQTHPLYMGRVIAPKFWLPPKS